MISGASEEELIEAIGRADVLLEFMPKIKQLQQENEQLSKKIDVWNKKYNDMFDENKQLKENYERIYNENCKLREEHNITDISLLDENYKLKDNWNKLKKYINEANEDLYWTNNYDDILYVMQELEGSDNNE